jgi:hypothetical protein
MRSRIGYAAFLALLLASSTATATAPLSFPSQELWIRTAQGDVFYVATDPNGTLTAACVEVAAGEGRWLPASMLADIREVNLDATTITHGMGFASSDGFLAGRGMQDRSLEITTYPAEGSTEPEGPEYSFLLDRDAVPFRVRRESVLSTDAMPPQPGTATFSRYRQDEGDYVKGYVDERWERIDPATIRDAPCRPPEAAPHTYSWPEARSVEADIDRDGVVDRFILGDRHDGLALRAIVAGVEQPLFELPADANRQFAICFSREEGVEPTIRVEPQTEAPLEALGSLPDGYRVCDACRQVVVSGGECDPVHFYWNIEAKRLDWWRE